MIFIAFEERPRSRYLSFGSHIRLLEGTNPIHCLFCITNLQITETPFHSVVEYNLIVNVSLSSFYLAIDRNSFATFVFLMN